MPSDAEVTIIKLVRERGRVAAVRVLCRIMTEHGDSPPPARVGRILSEIHRAMTDEEWRRFAAEDLPKLKARAINRARAADLPALSPTEVRAIDAERQAKIKAESDARRSAEGKVKQAEEKVKQAKIQRQRELRERYSRRKSDTDS